MFRTVAQFGVVAERTMAAIYQTLAGRFQQDTNAHRVLVEISEEEHAHAHAMLVVLAAFESRDVHYSAEAVALLEAQSVFLAEATEILLEAQDPDSEVPPLIERLVALEGSLTESLLHRLHPMLDLDKSAAIDRLLNETSRHEERLRDLL